MSGKRTRIAALAVLLSPLGGCDSDTTAPDHELGPQPDLVATVVQVNYESGLAPTVGFYSQYNLWLAVPPAETANAGVTISTSTPVFLELGGVRYTASGAEIRAGDRVDVWRDPLHVAHGVVQGPPGAPTYRGWQVVIWR